MFSDFRFPTPSVLFLFQQALARYLKSKQKIIDIRCYCHHREYMSCRKLVFWDAMNNAKNIPMIEVTPTAYKGNRYFSHVAGTVFVSITEGMIA